jgi:chromosome partitioning protein
MLTVSLISQKGGAGKSTLALHLATEATSRGLRALLVDLDPQGSAAVWGERRGELPPDVVAEHPANLERALKAAATAGYNLAVLDTAPHADNTATRAARLSDMILIPCRPASFDLEAIGTTLDISKMTGRKALVVINMAPIRSKVVNEAETDIAQRGGTVSPVVIRQRVAFQHCLIDGRTAAEFEPGGPAANELACLYDDMMMRLHDDNPTLRAA